MMNLFNHAPFWGGEGPRAKDYKGEVLYLEAYQGSKLRGDEICPTWKAFNIVLTHIGDDE